MPLYSVTYHARHDGAKLKSIGVRATSLDEAIYKVQSKLKPRGATVAVIASVGLLKAEYAEVQI